MKHAGTKQDPGAELEALRRRVDELETALGETAEKLGKLDGVRASLATPNQFMILGLFDFEDKPPKEIKDLQSGGSSGLPSLIMHRWCQMEPCFRVNSNLYARKPELKNMSKQWKWSHVGARIFRSRAEADAWLLNSVEGPLFLKYAEMVLAVSLTDYSIL